MAKRTIQKRVAGKAATKTPTESPRFSPVQRGHAADAIFDALAAAILRGEFEPGRALPPERVLGEEFGVSRIVLRQAVHRLADLGLVRVRQGGATTVCDPKTAGDIRLIGLYYALDPGGEAARAIRRDAIEKQFMQGFALIDVCERRATNADKAEIRELADQFEEAGATDADFAGFEEAFWRRVAIAGGNRIYEMEVIWWYETLADARPDAPSASPVAVRIAFYRELARRLVRNESPALYYHGVCAPQLDALFGREFAT